MSVVQLIRSILSLCPSEIRPQRLMPEELPHFFYTSLDFVTILLLTRDSYLRA